MRHFFRELTPKFLNWLREDLGSSGGMNSIERNICQMFIWHRVKASLVIIWQILSCWGINLLNIIQPLRLPNRADKSLICRHALNFLPHPEFGLASRTELWHILKGHITDALAMSHPAVSRRKPLFSRSGHERVILRPLLYLLKLLYPRTSWVLAHDITAQESSISILDRGYHRGIPKLILDWNWCLCWESIIVGLEVDGHIYAVLVHLLYVNVTLLLLLVSLHFLTERVRMWGLAEVGRGNDGWGLS